MTHLLLAVIYLSFISLGLPDSVLGAAWPAMYPELSVPISCAGVVSMIIAAGTVVSSLMSDRLTARFGTGKITAVSVAVTAVSLFGFSMSSAFWMLCLWAVPYGLGAGSVDASLNNYVALHYQSRHMSWLHCMWGIGAATGPAVIGYVLTNGQSWKSGYRFISLMQIVLTVILVCTLPLWKKRKTAQAENGKPIRPLTLRATVSLPGAKAIMAAFFCYSVIEQTTMLWASSYLVLCKSLSAETAASLSGLFFAGITVGRAASGFLTFRFSDSAMIRIGEGTIAVGILLLLLPFGSTISLVGFVLIGLGCAPIYPSIIHSTPTHFGEEHSQAMVGVEMASSYIGTCLMPPLFGVLATFLGHAFFPFYLLIALTMMVLFYERLRRVYIRNKRESA